jgi:hypothetical protein
MADPVTNWIDGRIKVAVDAAIDSLRDEIKEELQELKTDLLAQITNIPGLVAGQIGNVVVDAQEIANKVGDFLDPQDIANKINDLLDPQDWINQITGGVLQGIPKVFDPGSWFGKR